MLSLAVIFFVIALIAYALGARGIAGMSAGIGRMLLIVFLVLMVIVVLAGLFTGNHHLSWGFGT